KVLAELQKAACEANPRLAFRCEVTMERCLSAMAQLKASLKVALPGASDELIESTVTKICRDRATPYEFPGTHLWLEIIVSRVRQLAAARGISVPNNLVFGSLQVMGVNAEIELQTSAGTPLIMVNSLFFEFANELVKMVVQAISTHEDGR